MGIWPQQALLGWCTGEQDSVVNGMVSAAVAARRDETPQAAGCSQWTEKCRTGRDRMIASLALAEVGHGVAV